MDKNNMRKNEMIKVKGLYSCDIPEGIFNTIKKIKRVFIILEDRGDNRFKAVTTTINVTPEKDESRVYADITINGKSKKNCILADIIFILSSDTLGECLGELDEVTFTEVVSKAKNAKVLCNLAEKDSDDKLVYLRSVYLSNYRKYIAQRIDLKKGTNIIIGNNGAGKTSVLSGMATSLSNFQCALSGILDFTLSGDESRLSIYKHGEATYDVSRNFPIELVSAIHAYHSTYLLSQVKEQPNSIVDMQALPSTKDILEGSKNLPLLSFQKFDREWKLPASKKGTEVVIKTGLTERIDGYINCLNGDGIEDSIQKWCLKMSLLEYERKSEVKEFRTFQNIIRNFMQMMEEKEEVCEVRYSTDFSGLVYETSDGITPLSELSTGYKALLSMVMELAYRSVLLNPDTDDSKEISGIVLIDEIDAHLHPKWQWKVINVLENIFPRVQFIVATHSPMIISSAKNANIIVLDDEIGVDYLDSAYGYSAGDVLTLRQGTLDMPMKSKEYLDELEKALDNADTDSAKKIIDRAKEEYGLKSAFYQELYQTYKLNSWEN